MKFLVMVQKWMHLWCFFSITALHSASAGGAYCAKTAQARAAALGLEYPGVHGAPDLSPPAYYVKQPRTFSYDEMSPTPANMGIYSHYQQGGSPFDMTYHPRSSDWILPWVEGGSHTNQMLGFPRGQSPDMPESSSEEVKPVPQSQLDSMTPHDHKRPLPAVYKKHDLDDSAPNRRSMSWRGPFWPLIWGHATRGTLKKVAPPPHLVKKDKKKSRAVTGQWKVIRFPHRLVQNLRKNLNSKPFLPGTAVLKHQEKTKLRLKMAA